MRISRLFRGGRLKLREEVFIFSPITENNLDAVRKRNLDGRAGNKKTVTFMSFLALSKPVKYFPDWNLCTLMMPQPPGSTQCPVVGLV
jgi:hypothetical protein